MYTWILSTGWWKTRAPVNPDACFVVGFLCICLIGGFIYINRYLYISPPLLTNCARGSDLTSSAANIYVSQSEVLKAAQKKGKSVCETSHSNCESVFPMVCEPDIFGESSPSSCWWRGWSRSYRVSRHLLLPSSLVVYHVYEPKRRYRHIGPVATLVQLLP